MDIILFKEDWDRFPHIIADVNTPNRSWVRYCGILKQMGIKNYLFPLQLHNRELVGIDPLSPDLTTEQKELILLEVCENPFYFFREILRLSSKGEPLPVAVDANRGNISLWWAFFCYVVVYLIQIRQTGKSITVDALFTGLNEYWSISSSHIIITKDNTLRDENTERLKAMRNNLPAYLQIHGKGDLANTEKITVKALHNEIKILLAQKSKIAANALGRGLTTHTFGIDEFGFMYNNDISVPAALTAGSRARENAMANGLPCGTLFYTTPGYLSTKMGKFAHGYYVNGMQFTEELFDLKNMEELHSVLSKNSRGSMDILVIERNHQQLGISDEQLKGRIKAAGLSGSTLEAEMLNMWSDGSSDSVLNDTQIKILNNSKQDIDHTTYHNGYAINWYISKEALSKDRVMVVGSDTSELKGSDDTSLIVLDPVTGEVLGSGKYNKTNIIDFAQGVYDFMLTYYNAVLVIERKSTASAIIDYLLRAATEETTDYNIIDRIYHEYEGSDYIGKDNYEYAKKIGFGTAGRGSHARSVLFNDVLEDAVDTVGNTVRDTILVKQLTELEERNGRIDHPVGGHDDMALGWLLGQWFLRFGKGLDKFGINAASVLTALSLNAEQKDIKEAKRRADEIREISHYIDLLIKQLESEETTELEILRITAKLNYLSTRISSSSALSMNIEERIRNSLQRRR